MDTDKDALIEESNYTKRHNIRFTINVVFRKLNIFFYKIFKRILDIIISLVGLIFLLPLMLIIKIVFLISGDKDTIIFKQIRTGKNGKNFNLLKIRSMKISNDVRDYSKEDEFTKIGKFLRKTSIDEFPQLINILKGEMSFIGPRPWIPEYYENMNSVQRRRASVLPGVTGLAQVNGRNGISVRKKIKYDLYYVRYFGLKQDLVVIYKTIATVFKKEHAYTSKTGIKEEIEELKKQNK